MDRQEMFQGKRWGLFNHFLCVPAGDGTGAQRSGTPG